MPTLLCGLNGFSFAADGATTAGGVAEVFQAAMGISLEVGRSVIEVYRLERLAPEALLPACDFVLCKVPSWQFDLDSIESLHRELNDLRKKHDELFVNYSRVRESLTELAGQVSCKVVSAPTTAESTRKACFTHIERDILDATQKLDAQQESECDGYSPIASTLGRAISASRLAGQLGPMGFCQVSADVREVSEPPRWNICPQASCGPSSATDSASTAEDDTTLLERPNSLNTDAVLPHRRRQFVL